MREVIPYKDFPGEIAESIYRWLIVLSKDEGKGYVAKIIKKYDRTNESNFISIWNPIRNTIRSDRYYFRLLKAVISEKIKKCFWCKYYFNSKCRAVICKYNFSAVKTSNYFEVDFNEVKFILNFLTLDDEDKLAETVDKVENLYSYTEEQYQHEKVYVAIHNDLLTKGHFDKKASKAKVLELYGILPEDIKQILYEKIWNVVVRYDYLPYEEQLLLISKTLGNELDNKIREVLGTKKRFYDYGKNAVPPVTNEDTDSLEIYAWDEIPDEKTPEIELIDSEREVQYNKLEELRKDFGVIEDMFCSILLGEPNEVFIKHLKQIKRIKTKSGWEAFYRNTPYEDIRECLNDYFGYPVNESILKQLNESSNSEGGTAMSEKIKISVPKQKCVLCKYWVSWLPKKRIPTDCSPAFPGCPVHVYDMVYEFPIKAAALQFRIFTEKGDDEAAQEFLASAPNPTAIVKAAFKLPAEEVAAAMKEDEEELDIESMDRMDMLNLIIKCQLDIPGVAKMSDEELKEAIVELYENMDEDDDKRIGDVDDDESSEEDEVKVMHTVEPMKYPSLKK